jgi:hypothetical protein
VALKVLVSCVMKAGVVVVSVLYHITSLNMVRLYLMYWIYWNSVIFFSQAAEALRAMNGATLGSKQIVVRLHEPKQLRQEKLAQRFGHNGHPRRSSSGATSPAISETGEPLFGGWNSPRLHHSALGSPALSPKSIHFERTERGRRGSGSYYTVCSIYLLEY